MNDSHDSDAARIQADIGRTRDDLDRTLAAIERRMAPGQLMEDGVHYLRNNGATEYVQNLGTAAKNDPIPLALVGVGIAWLMLSNARSRSMGDVESRSRVGDAASAVGDKASAAASAVGDTASGVASSVKDTFASVKDKVSRTAQRMSDTADSARDGARRVGDTARQVGSTARQGAQKVRGSYDYLVSEQPLAIGAIGLALGVALAAAAPRTRTEDDLLGDTSERLKDDMRQSGREQMDKAKHALGAAEEAARQSFDDTQPPASAETHDAPKPSSYRPPDTPPKLPPPEPHT